MKTVVVVSIFVVALCEKQFEEYYEESSSVSNKVMDPMKQIYFREQRETIMDYSRKLLGHSETVNYKPKFKKMQATIARHLNSIRRNYPSEKLRNQMLELYKDLPDRAGGRYCGAYEEAVVHLQPYAVMMQDREAKIKKLQSVMYDSEKQIKSCDRIGTAEALERGACLATLATNREKDYNTFIIEDLFTNARLDLFAVILPLVLDSADAGPFEMLTNAAMILATKAFACRLNITMTFVDF